ncbi:MAG: tRNA 2-thiouridine(34) synthase MnmA, partial [Candidatus Magasanikbacteria bacterium]|nr:tRNA 2-thiouridine(34) synthase MnmA [Candidatus Magasanikbacteria bacterium]
MMNKKNKIKVLMCLSGGVDSSVAAALLVKAGYDVTAAFMVNYDELKNGVSCWHPDYQDALRVSAKLGIKLLRLDFTKEYARDVLQYMYAEYDRGRTPNPDVLCNKFVKFGAWLKKADELGFDFIATGHYARTKKKGKDVLLVAAKDTNKDQTYFLHQLSQQQLSRTMFPIGDYTKEEVRKLAHKFDLSTAQKEESMGICFIGEVSMKDFLKDKVKATAGNIVDTAGNILGEHTGLPFYTIGQRGVGLSNTGGKTLFVVDKDISKNELIVGEEG